MKINKFEIQKGIFHFEIDNINTSFHSHPTHEFLFSKSGNLIIEIENKRYENIQFAFIHKNTVHKIVSTNSKIELVMIEDFNSKLLNFCRMKYLNSFESFFAINEYLDQSLTFDEIIQFALENELKTFLDKRVNQTIYYIESNTIEPNKLLKTLTDNVNLSESRLSHLFKENMGISLKNYLIWSNLKKSINLNLNSGQNFTNISIENGFFDQAHFSKAFRRFLGVSPSFSYNSNTIQVKLH